MRCDRGHGKAPNPLPLPRVQLDSRCSSEGEAMPNHAPPTKWWGGETHVWQSWSPRRLLFFVHGFGGRNTATWLNFPTLLLDDPNHASDDLIFYGYEGRRQSGNASSGLLYQRCNELLSQPERFQTPLGFQRRHDFSYEHVVFISHSLGGPVVRSMLLRAHQDGVRWLDRVTLIFFAPATAGARAERIRQLVTQWRPAGILALVRFSLLYGFFRWPVVDDLKVDSSFLVDICNRTQELITAGHQSFRSRLTLFGALENVIDLSRPNLSFDDPYTYLAGRDHMGVCKPVRGTDDPYHEFSICIGPP
jgi:Putative serine esterase (DUF676)